MDLTESLEIFSLHYAQSNRIGRRSFSNDRRNCFMALFPFSAQPGRGGVRRAPRGAISLSLLRFHRKGVRQLPVARGLRRGWPSWVAPSPAPRLSAQPQRRTCGHTCCKTAAVSRTSVAVAAARTGACPRGESFGAVPNPSTPAGGSPAHLPPDPRDPPPRE